MDKIVVSCLFGALILSSGRVAVAAEGASSNYFPGSYGTVAVATPPTVGWTYLNYNLFYAADADSAVLQGRLNVDLDTLDTEMGWGQVQRYRNLAARPARPQPAGGRLCSRNADVAIRCVWQLK